MVEHLRAVKALHQADLAKGFGEVYLPFALARKYPRAPAEWAWQFVFPAAGFSRDPRSGIVRRHHLHPRPLQRAFKRAVSTTEIYTHVLQRGGKGVRSPLDGL